MAKCIICKQNKVTWSLLYLEVNFSAGWPEYHVSDWKGIEVCDKCKEKISTRYKRERSDMSHVKH